MLKDYGHLCYITSNKWMRAGYGEKLRIFFAKQTNPKKLLDFASLRVFENATVDTNIFLTQNAPSQSQLQAISFKDDFQLSLDVADYASKNTVRLPHLSGDTWFIGSTAEIALKEKIERVGVPLKEWDITIYRGVLTGYNDAFVIDNKTKEALIKEDPKSAEIIKPVLRGRDIQRYQAKWVGRWLIDAHNGYGDTPPINIDDYKAVKKHLDKFFPQLKKRQDKGMTPYNLRNCAYHAEFENEKIIYPNMTKFLPFIYDDKSMYANQKCFIITGKSLKYLAGWLNSKIFRAIFKDNFPELQGGTRELSKIFFEKLPVPVITEHNKKLAQTIECMVNKILIVKEENINANITTMEDKIDRLVYRLYALNEKEIQLIEKKG